MDPLTHALTSVAMGRAGLNRVARAATPILLVSGVIADIDWLARFGGAAAFLRGHRTFTHSLPGTAAIILVVAAGFWAAGRAFPRWTVSFLPCLVLCAAGAAGHLFLDMLNPYGVKLLWPFQAKWYAWDMAREIDTWILFILLAGVLVPELFRLVHEEIGSKSKRNGRVRGAILSLTLVALFVAGRALTHERAIAVLNSRTYRVETPRVVAAFPQPSNPLLWSGVVETDSAIINLEVPLWPGSVFDPESAEVHFKPTPSTALESAVNSATAKEFLNFARFPIATVESGTDGYQVRLRDLRFGSEPPGQRGPVAIISLDTQPHVVSGRIEFDSAKER